MALAPSYNLPKIYGCPSYNLPKKRREKNDKPRSTYPKTLNSEARSTHNIQCNFNMNQPKGRF